jgi:hypothetical protein
MHLGLWDIGLIVLVSLQATVLAYLPKANWKALVLSLPIPFTLATLAVGRPMDATNASGLLLLLVFIHGVRTLHERLRVPIVPSIVLNAGVYCAFGWLLTGALPLTPTAFWLCLGLSSAVAIAFLAVARHREEPDYRTPLPVWVKLPAIMLVILALVLMKQWLRGFVTTFPMMTVVAAYEMRYSLGTTCRQMPVILLAMATIIAVCYLGQEPLGIGGALAVGWAGYLAVVAALSRRAYGQDR